MGLIKKCLIGIVVLLLISSIALLVTGHGFIFTSIQRTYLAGHVTANINDHGVFENRIIKTSQSEELTKDERFSQVSLTTEQLDELKNTGSAAYLVVKDGKVLAEYYFNGYDDRSKTNSFSMAKTVTTLLLGIAIEEGYVRDLDQPITDFIPEFKDDPIGKNATIGQFSLMNSGYEWDEQYYTPFSPTVELYYGNDIVEFLTQGEFSAEPGTFWEYSSASTQIMGIFLLRALQKVGVADSLSEYLSKKIWQPMQMNDDAVWHLDNSGMELVYCCINTNARNFAKLGLLMLNGGRWNDQQLVPEAFIEEMVKTGMQDNYGLSTWLNYSNDPKFYWFSGHLGQSIIVVPEQNMVVVRLGERTGVGVNDFHLKSIPGYIDMALSLTSD